MGRGRGGFAAGLDSFSKSYALTKGVMQDYRDRQAVNKDAEDMDKAAAAEAAATGGTTYTVDRGQDSAAPDYVTKDKATAEMMKQQQDDIDSMSDVAATATAGEINRPKSTTMDVYHKKYAADKVARLMAEGKHKEASAFEDWSRTAKGASYMDSWNKAHQAGGTSTTQGIQALSELYNKQLPDGKYAVTIPGKDGNYEVQIRDEKTHAVISKQQGNGDDMMRMGWAGMAPEKVFQHFNTERAAQAESATKERHRTEDHAYDMEKERVKADKPQSPYAKALADYKRAAAADPNDPELPGLKQYADKLKTTGGGSVTNVHVGSQIVEMADGRPGVKVDTPDGKSKVRPVEGAITPAQKELKAAENYMSHVKTVTSPSGLTSYTLDGVPVRGRAAKDEIAKQRAVINKAYGLK